MNKYNRLQKDFAEMIRANNLLPLLNEIIPAGELEPAESLLVYQNGYYARMTEAMGETFEAVWRMLGDEDFFAVCREYISSTLSQSYNISEYGNSFPGFLRDRFPDIPLLDKIASFEITFRDLFHMAFIVSAPDFSRLTGPDAKIYFNANARFFAFSGPVYTIWKNRDNPDFSLKELDLTRPEYVLLYKNGNNTIYAQELDFELFSILKKLEAGLNIAEALEETDEAGEKKINDFFSFLSTSGIIEKIA